MAKALPMEEEGEGMAIGIDLGTTYSCAAVWYNNCVNIIPNDQGNRTTPSCVAFTPSQRLFGDAAKNQVVANYANTIYDSKRLIGRRFSDETVQNDMKIWPFTVIRGEDDKPVIAVSYKGVVKQFVPEQISSLILAKMKDAAEASIGTKVKNAVVTVPAYFNNSQRQATIAAGTIAGLNVMRIINEPTAAAIAYGHIEHASLCNENARNILVFDLGGGTFDVSLVFVANNSFEVKAICGDTHLGGVDFDNNVVSHFVDEFKRKHSKDINGNHRALERLRVACEKAKRSLSFHTETKIEVDHLYEDVDFSSILSRDQFEMLNMSLFTQCIEAVERCLSEARMNKGDVHDVVLVGGSTQIPKVQELLQVFFDGKELCKSLNVDEGVAHGAAIQAAILSGVKQSVDFSLLDVTPLSLGCKNSSGRLECVIPRNTQIPMKRKYKYLTVEQNQTNIPIRVLELEDNHILGIFNLDGNNPAATGVFRLMTSFEIDANSILTVTSVEEKNSRPIKVTEDSGSLSQEKINRMVEEAKKYIIEDKEQLMVEEAKKYIIQDKEQLKVGNVKNEVKRVLSDMSVTLSCYGKMESVEKRKLKDVIRETNQWLDLSLNIEDACKFEDKLKELHNFRDSLKGHVSIGIDLGTTYSCVGVWQQGRVNIIPNDQGSRTTPSMVAFTRSQRLIGELAKIGVRSDPSNIIYDSKRLIGRRFTDQIVQNDMKLWPFKVLQAANYDKPVIEISYKGKVKHFIPEQITAMILANMKETTEAYLGTEVKNVVVTVPAYFNDSQRQATIDAGTIAGLNVMRIINEPTAAAIAYGLLIHDSIRNVEPRNILVFDLGGGTFDVSLVVVAKGSTFEVKATVGDTHLGGVDFDINVVNHFVDKFKRQHSKDINGNHIALQRLRVVCEKAKRSLSLNTETTIEVDYLYEGVDFSSPLSRDEFERLNMSLFRECIEVVKKCLQDAKMDKGNIDDVVLVGGSTRIPKVQQLLQEFFEEKELCKSLNADEAVASGAAIQAAILSGTMHNREFLVSDVNSFPLVVGNDDGEWNIGIPKNTPIPTKQQWTSTSIDHNRKYMLEKVHENERPMLKNTQGISMDNVDGIPPTPKDTVTGSIDTLEVDANGIYTWTSVTKNFWGKSHTTFTKHNGVLSEDEINWMAEEAKKYKEEDIEHMNIEKARCEVQVFVSTMADNLISRGNYIRSEDKRKLEDVIQNAFEWLDGSINVEPYDARLFEDKLKELRDIYSTIWTVTPAVPGTRGKNQINTTTGHIRNLSNNKNDLMEIDSNKYHKENMEKETNKYQEGNQEKLDKAKYALRTYLISMAEISGGNNIKNDEKKKLDRVIEDTYKWMGLNPELDDAGVFEDKLKELQGFCKPFAKKPNFFGY